MTNLATSLVDHAERDPDRPALRVGARAWSYGSLRDEARRAAGLLTDHGVGHRRVGLLLPNVAAFPPFFYGALWTGATLVPMNPTLAANDIAAHVEDSTMSVVVTMAGGAAAAKQAAGLAGAAVIVAGPGGVLSTSGLNATIAAGACLSLLPRFDPRRLLATAAMHQATIVRAGYGRPETSPLALVMRRSADRDGMVGVPPPGTAIRLLDVDGQDVRPGDVGEIAVRGDGLMTGYWHAPEMTAAAMPGGWFHTGDLARRDERGEYHLVPQARGHPPRSRHRRARTPRRGPPTAARDGVTVHHDGAAVLEPAGARREALPGNAPHNDGGRVPWMATHSRPSSPALPRSGCPSVDSTCRSPSTGPSPRGRGKAPASAAPTTSSSMGPVVGERHRIRALAWIEGHRAAHL